MSQENADKAALDVARHLHPLTAER